MQYSSGNNLINFDKIFNEPDYRYILCIVLFIFMQKSTLINTLWFWLIYKVFNSVPLFSIDFITVTEYFCYISNQNAWCAAANAANLKNKELQNCLYIKRQTSVWDSDSFYTHLYRHTAIPRERQTDQKKQLYLQKETATYKDNSGSSVVLHRTTDKQHEKNKLWHQSPGYKTKHTFNQWIAKLSLEICGYQIN